MKKIFIFFISALGIFIAASNLSATEGGGGAYPNGAEGFMAGAVPPPGTYFIDYLTFYSADRFNDNDGKSAVPNFKLDATANVFRLLHVTKKQILGGNYAFHLFIPLVNLEVTAGPTSDSKAGIGDIIIDPIILSWHSKNFHAACGLDVYIPTGSYSKSELANLGRNYYTFEPVFAFTYLSDNGFETSFKFMYDINTKNKDTQYDSGDEFHFDYTIAKKINNVTVGIGGYYYKQISDDKLNGVKFGVNGNRGAAFAYGPQVKYDHKNMSFILKYQTEDAVKNKPEGDKLWIKFIYAF